MKYFKAIALLAMFLVALTGVAVAGVNPTSPGLPGATAWGHSGTIPNNGASAMCVDCHTANPAQRMVKWWGYAAGARTGTRNIAALATESQGTHWVHPLSTNTGGGYPGSKGGARSNGYYEKVSPWAGWVSAGTATTTSKYAGASSDNTSTGGYDAGGKTDRTPTRGGMICESCHNIIKNVQSGGQTYDNSTFPGNRKLLAWATNNGSADMCYGCHGNMDANVNNDGANYFGPSMAVSVGRDHHRNTLLAGNATDHLNNANNYGGQGTVQATAGIGAMQYLRRSWYDNTNAGGGETAGYGGKMWAVSFGQQKNLPRAIAFDNSNDAGIRNAVVATGDIVLIGGSSTTTLTCTQCHRAHGAVTNAGSLILKSGTGANLVGLGATSGTSPFNPYINGLIRQNDKGDPSAYTTKLLQDERPLCGGCHTGYSN